jgi:hypothetical protein
LQTKVQTNQTTWFGCRASTNFSPKKTRGTYSEPNQDAELPSKITGLINTQPRGLCREKKSEPESLADQPGIDEEIDHPIAATNSSQPTPINLDSSKLHQSSRTEVFNHQNQAYLS